MFDVPLVALPVRLLPPFLHHAHRPNQGVIKRDWVATGRIDFAAQITKIRTNPADQLNSSSRQRAVGSIPRGNTRADVILLHR